MNISKLEQRVLHKLAQGGEIRHDQIKGRVLAVECVTREGWTLGDCTLEVFQKLRRRRLIRSSGGAPYRISPEGLKAVRAQLDNQ